MIYLVVWNNLFNSFFSNFDCSSAVSIVLCSGSLTQYSHFSCYPLSSSLLCWSVPSMYLLSMSWSGSHWKAISTAQRIFTSMGVCHVVWSWVPRITWDTSWSAINSFFLLSAWRQENGVRIWLALTPIIINKGHWPKLTKLLWILSWFERESAIPFQSKGQINH